MDIAPAANAAAKRRIRGMTPVPEKATLLRTLLRFLAAFVASRNGLPRRMANDEVVNGVVAVPGAAMPSGLTKR
jgi:hypothetical protein